MIILTSERFFYLVHTCSNIEMIYIHIKIEFEMHLSCRHSPANLCYEKTKNLFLTSDVGERLEVPVENKKIIT
jgi:hypothetical protein